MIMELNCTKLKSALSVTHIRFCNFMNGFMNTIRMFLSGKHRIITYSLFEIVAIIAIVAFFIFMLNL